MQFHPESVLTPDGPALMANFLQVQRPANAAPSERRRPPMPLPRELLEKLLDRRDLSEAEAQELLGHLTNPETPPAMSGAVLAALRSKGVVADELRGFALHDARAGAPAGDSGRMRAPSTSSARAVIRPAA